MKEKEDYEIKYIKVLDGIRALAIMVIVWFHFWQQSWIYHQIGNVSLDFLPRYGYLLVDMMILLSSFCLFLPYARSMVYNEEAPNAKKFYLNRVARILPSYLFSMIISIVFIIICSKEISLGFFIKDTITHLLFIHNNFSDTLLYSNYMAVLWTLSVEVQFYFLFPYLAKKFIKKPVITYLIMIFIGIISTLFFIINCNDNNISFFVNHVLTFFMVYANGMLGAWLYVKFTKNKKRNLFKDLCFTFISIGCIYIYRLLCLSINGNFQEWQLNYRLVLSVLFLIFIISTIMSYKYYRKIFENKIMKFIAVISFNLYIYHQFIAVKLKEFKIPHWSGDISPNFTGDVKWQWTYFLLCIIVSLVVAIIMTYCVEKPFSKIIKKKYVEVVR